MMNEENNILILGELNTHPEDEFIKQVVDKTAHVITINSYQSEIAQAYGDVMRSIILSIYQKNIQEIYIIGKDEAHNLSNIHLSEKIKSMESRLKTIDYLFKNCKPEMNGESIIDWLNGERDVHKRIEESVNQIYNHPLVPENIKISGIIFKENDAETIIQETT
ncbi:hypothetical protein [Mammaliicoccus lentus]|uniref:hypothetical protein n=1 Tax=Mammaliicoccus lentus TaxID=42858 RepID=UPI001C4F6F84|nr:hypothetical protein [Mammaliicoccus lentus]MBW0763010.1 hypothetical protein [Mammaliicoccus lentus]